jgi:hypothetical protein
LPSNGAQAERRGMMGWRKTHPAPPAEPKLHTMQARHDPKRTHRSVPRSQRWWAHLSLGETDS